METFNLPKIGTRIDSRIAVWQKIYSLFSNLNVLPEKEVKVLKLLANGATWSSLIPEEWRNIYSAIYDESASIIVDDKEKIKIEKDINRTFTLFFKNARYLHLNFLEDMTIYNLALYQVLVLVSIERGYCQGINFIAAELLLELSDTKEAFIVLSYLLKNCHLEILFDPRYSALFDYLRLFEKKLRRHNNKLYKYFKKLDFRPSSYAIEMFTTCFVVTSPGDIALCLIDLILADVDDIMMRIGLAILSALQPRLSSLNFEQLHEHFKEYALRADPIFVVVQALMTQFNAKTSILKGMVRKIEHLDPESQGDLKFGQSQKPKEPSPQKLKKYKNQNRGYISDDTLSEEFLPDDDGYDDINPLNKEMHLKLDDTPDVHALLASDLKNPDGAGVVKRERKRDKLAKLALKIAPRRLHQWREQRKAKIKNEAAVINSNSLSRSDDEEGEEEDKSLTYSISSHANSLSLQSVENKIKDFDTKPESLESPTKADPAPQATTPRSPWWNFKWRSTNSAPRTENPSTVNSNQSSTNASENTTPKSTLASSNPSLRIDPSPENNNNKMTPKSSDKLSPTNYNHKNPRVPRTDTNSTDESLNSTSNTSSQQQQRPRYRRVRVCEKPRFNSFEEEDQAVHHFFEVDDYDTLIITHFQTPDHTPEKSEMYSRHSEKLSPSQLQQQQNQHQNHQHHQQQQPFSPHNAQHNHALIIHAIRNARSYSQHTLHSVDEYDGDKECDDQLTDKEKEDPEHAKHENPPSHFTFNSPTKPIIPPEHSSIDFDLNSESLLHPPLAPPPPVHHHQSSQGSDSSSLPPTYPYSHGNPSHSPMNESSRNSYSTPIYTPTRSKQDVNEIDLVDISVEHIHADTPIYIDQGGDFISMNFHQTNHLISDVIDNALNERYFDTRFGTVDEHVLPANIQLLKKHSESSMDDSNSSKKKAGKKSSPPNKNENHNQAANGTVMNGAAKTSPPTTSSTGRVSSQSKAKQLPDQSASTTTSTSLPPSISSPSSALQEQKKINRNVIVKNSEIHRQKYREADPDSIYSLHKEAFALYK